MTTDESAQTDVLLCDLGVFVQGIPPKIPFKASFLFTPTCRV